MPLTRSFNELVRSQLQEDTAFRQAYLGEAVTSMAAGEVESCKSILRKYINGTIEFIALGEALGRSSKTLMQMLGPKGNPNIRNFFEIVAYLQAVEGLSLTVSAKKIPKKTLAKMKKTSAQTLTKKAA